MYKVLVVMRHEFMTLVTKPSFWISLIGLPIFMAFVMVISLVGSVAATAATASSRQGRNLVQGYIDRGGFIKTVPDGLILHAYPDESNANDALTAGQIAGYFVVATDYITTGNVTYVSPDFSPLNSPTEAFQRVLRYNLVGGDQQRLARADTAVTVQREEALAPPTTRGGKGLPFPLLPMFAGIMFMIVMVTASSYLMHTVTTEKETRVMEVLMSSITPQQMLTGKILGLGVVGLVQLVLWLGSSLSGLAYIPGASSLGSISAGSVIVMVVYAILGYFIYASLMAGLGALMPGTREAAQYSFFVILPLLIPMWLLTPIVLEPDGPLAVVLSLVPFTSPIVMAMRVSATDVPLWQILVGIGLLAGTVYIVIHLAARIFRAQSLLSGAKPSLREIAQALR